MLAMILAAGLGTRLRPLTLVRPKVLVPVSGMPVFEFLVHRLHQSGVEAVMVNAFQLKDEMVAAVRENKWPVPIHVRLEPILLGTGGGLRNFLDLMRADESFIALNGDIICDAPFDHLYRLHLDTGGRVSLLLHDCPEFNNVAVDPDDQILAFGREAVDLKKVRPELRLLAFTGIHFLDPSVLKDLPAGEPSEIIPVYRGLIERGEPPRALYHPGLFWRETGSIEAYFRLNIELAGMREGVLNPLATGRRICIHPRSHVSPGARLDGVVHVGKDSRIAEGSRLEDVIIWDGVDVRAGSRLRRCIVADGVTISGVHEGEVLHVR
jgi:mannose-1-phosphate guanylyltransferase